MTNLTNGYYWLKNNSWENKVFFRPIAVTVITESGYYFKHQWYSPGTYFQWIGDEGVYHINYFDDPVWQGREFIRLEEPK